QAGGYFLVGKVLVLILPEIPELVGSATDIRPGSLNGIEIRHPAQRAVETYVAQIGRQGSGKQQVATRGRTGGHRKAVRGNRTVARAADRLHADGVSDS